jgi:hypothetical protein
MASIISGPTDVVRRTVNIVAAGSGSGLVRAGRVSDLRAFGLMNLPNCGKIKRLAVDVDQVLHVVFEGYVKLVRSTLQRSALLARS